MASITMTNVDPGEGSPLSPDNYLAVYGGQSILDIFYPIGATYKTFDVNFNPNTAWGGVWEEMPESNGENAIVTPFEFKGKFSTAEGTIVKKTNKGTSLTFGWGDYGMDMAIFDGADDVYKVRVSYSISTSTSTTGQYGVFGVSSATIWTNWTGIRNGTGGDGNSSYTPEGPSTAGGYSFYFSTLCDMNGGSKGDTFATVDFIRRLSGSGVRWCAQGSMSSAGSGSFISFASEMTAFSTSAVPCVYQRGMQAFDDVRYTFEVFEPISGKDYRIWRRTA